MNGKYTTYGSLNAAMQKPKNRLIPEGVNRASVSRCHNSSAPTYTCSLLLLYIEIHDVLYAAMVYTSPRLIRLHSMIFRDTVHFNNYYNAPYSGVMVKSIIIIKAEKYQHHYTKWHIDVYYKIRYKILYCYLGIIGSGTRADTAPCKQYILYYYVLQRTMFMSILWQFLFQRFRHAGSMSSWQLVVVIINRSIKL